jgi:thioredoxin 1
MYGSVETLGEFEKISGMGGASLFYFSGKECGVCKVLKPKIEELFEDRFDKVDLWDIDIERSPELSAQLSIFTIPTVILFIDGKEFVRQSRSISISQLAENFSRPYQMFFEE